MVRDTVMLNALSEFESLIILCYVTDCLSVCSDIK